MNRFEKAIGQYKVIIHCIPSLYRQAAMILEVIKCFHEKSGWLGDGVKIKVGWSIFTLCAKEQFLIVYEPDYTKNPVSDLREDISCSLGILAEQVNLLKRLNIEAEDISFQDKILVAHNALKQRKVYLERKRSENSGQSAWYIGIVEGDEPAEKNEIFFVYDLVQIRPALLKAMTLPSGFLIVFDGNEIEAVLNEKNENIWMPEEGSA